MPYKCQYKSNSTTILSESPLEFCVKQYDWKCKLSYQGESKDGKYLLWINGVLVTDLPAAPPIKKEDIPPVCQSDNLVF